MKKLTILLLSLLLVFGIFSVTAGAEAMEEPSDFGLVYEDDTFAFYVEDFRETDIYYQIDFCAENYTDSELMLDLDSFAVNGFAVSGQTLICKVPAEGEKSDTMYLEKKTFDALGVTPEWVEIALEVTDYDTYSTLYITEPFEIVLNGDAEEYVFDPETDPVYSDDYLELYLLGYEEPESAYSDDTLTIWFYAEAQEDITLSCDYLTLDDYLTGNEYYDTLKLSPDYPSFFYVEIYNYVISDLCLETISGIEFAYSIYDQSGEYIYSCELLAETGEISADFEEPYAVGGAVEEEDEEDDEEAEDEEPETIDEYLISLILSDDFDYSDMEKEDGAIDWNAFKDYVLDVVIDQFGDEEIEAVKEELDDSFDVESFEELGDLTWEDYIMLLEFAQAFEDGEDIFGEDEKEVEEICGETELYEDEFIKVLMRNITLETEYDETTLYARVEIDNNYENYMYVDMESFCINGWLVGEGEYPEIPAGKKTVVKVAVSADALALVGVEEVGSFTFVIDAVDENWDIRIETGEIGVVGEDWEDPEAAEIFDLETIYEEDGVAIYFAGLYEYDDYWYDDADQLVFVYENNSEEDIQISGDLFYVNGEEEYSDLPYCLLIPAGKKTVVNQVIDYDYYDDPVETVELSFYVESPDWNFDAFSSDLFMIEFEE